MSFRRFVYLVTDDSKWRDFMVRRIDMSRFFLPRDLLGQLFPSSPALEAGHLPPPDMRFSPPTSKYKNGSMRFMRLGWNRVVATDQTGRTVVCDPGLRTVRTMPNLTEPKCWPASFNVGNDLYILDTVFNVKHDRKLCFDGLIFKEDRDSHGHDDWYCHSLPPPPYTDVWNYAATDETPAHITSYTVVDGPNIWISRKSLGTHSFNIAASSWSKVGDWALPFSGCAHYVPEYRLWFGLSSDGDDDYDRLCASDLTVTPPAPLYLRSDRAPPDWMGRSSYLVYLGCSKFCLARFFRIIRSPGSFASDHYVEFSGLEVLRCGESGDKLGAVRHRSEVYSLVNKIVHWVL